MTARLTPRNSHCENCKSRMAEVRRSGQRFCCSRCSGQYWLHPEPVSCGECGTLTVGGKAMTGLCMRCAVRRNQRSALRKQNAALAAHRNRVWTRDALVWEIQLVAKLIGATPAASDMRSTVVSAAVRECGSWSKAVSEAGMEPRPKGGAGRQSREATAGVTIGRNRQMVTGGELGAKRQGPGGGYA